MKSRWIRMIGRFALPLLLAAMTTALCGSLHADRRTAEEIRRGEHAAALTLGGVPASERAAWRQAAMDAPQYLFRCCAEQK